ncbi:TetR/AcrR family transcriptional regulator [Rudaeicoccus suwonensis]|uniref:TetR family transcriptional regulator n=1 Tax=Rudaeicoccus suwonensis TaxID=657409 RepID=A0A561E906_9MICO|nr:hypothetical protein [Rudaeicoccus suwonensis]TWE12067.1 TetR family transcriptional regulator [Rudaeicoccus suwonensis]
MSTRKKRAHRARRGPEGSQARQEHLLQSSIAVVGSGGLRGLTHRAVDREADLPEGTCSVYFRTRLALLTALTNFVAAQLTGDVLQMGDALPEPQPDGDPGDAIVAAIDMLQRWAQDPALMITMCELALEAARTPSLRDPIVTWRQHLTDAVEAIVRRGCRTEPRRRAEAIVASIDGVMLSSLQVTTPTERATYVRSTVALILQGIVNADT